VLGVSERFACGVTGQHRATQRHEPAAATPADPDAALRDWLRAYAKDHPRRGFRPAYHDARAEGWAVNHKKIQRLWRDEGLRVPHRRKRKRHGSATAPHPAIADAPNRVWAVDFQFDVTTDGRPIKIVSIIDEHTRECLGGMVERSITGEHLTNELDLLAAQRGTYPNVLRCDNGPRIDLQRNRLLGQGSGRVALHPARRALAKRLRRIVQLAPARRMPQYQQLLVNGPRPSGHQRLEKRLQPTSSPLRLGLPTPGALRSQLRPLLNAPSDQTGYQQRIPRVQCETRYETARPARPGPGSGQWRVSFV